jgi:hypothetical protein
MILTGSGALCQDPELPQERVTITLTNGETLKDVRLWSYSNGVLEYESNEVLKDIRVIDIKQIKGNLIYQITQTISKTQSSDNTLENSEADLTPTIKKLTITSDHTSTQETSASIITVDNKNYFSLGQSDAKKYYQQGNDVNLIRKMVINPNLHLLQDNGEYQRGYMQVVKRKRARSTFLTLTLILYPIILIATGI